MNITRLADQREILVRIHRLSLLFSHYVPLYIPTVMTSLKKHVEPITAPLVRPYKPSNAF